MTSATAARDTGHPGDEAWAASALHRRVVGAFGEVPALLATTLDTDAGVHAAPAHWHCAIYGDLVLRQIGATFTAADCYRVLKAHGLTYQVDAVVAALVGFLDHLRAAGHLAYQVSHEGRPAGPIRVVGNLRPEDITAPAAPPTPAVTTTAVLAPADQATPESPGLAPVQPEPTPSAPAAVQEVVQVATPVATQPPAPAATVDPTPALVAAVREPRTATERAWLDATTKTLTVQGYAEPVIADLLGIIKWGADLIVEPAHSA